MIIPPVPAIPTPTFNPPTPSFTSIQGSMNVLAALLGRDGPEVPDVSRYRTKTNIVLSCLSTMFACTWLALHIGVPQHNKGPGFSLGEKLTFTFVALMAPEVIAMIAIKERWIAKRNQENWNANFLPWCSPELIEILGKTPKQYEDELKEKKYDSRWTLTHGFLAQMGGIRLYNDGDDYPKNFVPNEAFFKDPRMRPIIQQIGLISSEDIEDKSKRDGIGKFFVVIQTTWFIVQCLARWANHLPVTEFEAVTLAYAVMNIFIYIIWWNKPQSLSVPYRFYLGNDEDNSLTANSDIEQEELLPLMHSPKPNITDEALNLDTLPKSAAVCERCRRIPKKRRPFASEWIQPTYSGVLRRVGLKTEDATVTSCFLFAGTIFGSLHLIPIWLSVFPSNPERILWTISASYAAAAPVTSTLLVVASTKASSNSKALYLLYLPRVFYFVTSAIYFVARVILLVLTFTTLRSLPAEAFLSVQWTRYIPHF